MALTPEDVVNKRFQPTKFREGYDQDEVDDFLDEVVVELRRLNQENEELKQRLAASDSRVSELQRSGGSSSSETPAAEAPAAPVVEEAAAPPAPEPETTAPPQAESTATTAVPVAAAYSAPQVGDPNDPQSTNNLLQLARRLHEEHVREGMQKRDGLVAEGHATAARIVAEAEQQQKAQIAVLDRERTDLEQRIDGLRTFEREYRQKLRGYIEGQLHELDESSSPASGSEPVSADSDASRPPSYQGFGG